MPPVLLAAPLVASSSGPALAVAFAAVGFIAAGSLLELRRPSVLVTSLGLVGRDERQPRRDSDPPIIQVLAEGETSTLKAD